MIGEVYALRKTRTQPKTTAHPEIPTGLQNRESTREVSRGADIEAVNSAISELRRNGFEIKTRREGGIYYYKLVA